MSVATNPAGRIARSALTTKGRAAVALIQIRDGWEQLSVFEQAALTAKLADLVDAYIRPRRPRPVA